jgi:transcriptional regulator with XRE-family HTH domain
MSVKTEKPPAKNRKQPPEIVDPAHEATALGKTIRRLRLERNLSLQQLSGRTEISVGMLSHIERGISSPSLKSLTRIRLALGVPISALFEGGEKSKQAEVKYVRRHNERPSLDLGPQFLVKELLSPSTARDLQFMILHIPPGGGSGEVPYTSPGEKAGLVLEGTLRVHIGEDMVDIHAGDSVQFDSSIPHRFGNPTNSGVRVLWIIGQLPLERHL